jgi:hypothetical protein
MPVLGTHGRVWIKHPDITSGVFQDISSKNMKVGGLARSIPAEDDTHLGAEAAETYPGLPESLKPTLEGNVDAAIHALLSEINDDHAGANESTPVFADLSYATLRVAPHGHSVGDPYLEVDAWLLMYDPGEISPKGLVAYKAEFTSTGPQRRGTL